MEMEIPDLKEISLKSQTLFFDDSNLQDTAEINTSNKMAKKYNNSFATSQIDANPFNLSYPHASQRQEKSFESNIYIDEFSELYNMTHSRRGKAVILNHSKYEDGELKERTGSNFDADVLKKTLEMLKFEVILYIDLRSAEIRETMQKLAQENHSQSDCIAVFVLSHGQTGGLIASYDGYYPIEKLWKPFTAENCETLAGKPKLFFFQICRGSNLDFGVRVRKPSASRTETDSGSFSYKLPTHADFLLAFSTAEEFASFREPTSGSWYIQTLCKIFQKYYKQYDLLKMLTTVSREVALKFQSSGELHGYTQIPNFSSMLMRDVYFN